ncbi:MAG: AMP-binding protein [Desulfobacterales bacterium]
MALFKARQLALEMPDKPSVIMGSSGETITSSALESGANRCAHLFRDLGLRYGDTIAILMENHPRFIEICMAADRSGLIYTPISIHLNPSEIEYILNDCGARVLFTSWAKRDLADELHPPPSLNARFMIGGCQDNYTSYDDVIASYPAEPIPDEKTGKDMVYSSGTTGRPKGIKVNLPDLAFGEMSPAADLVTSLFDINEDAVYLSPAPLYHAGPLRFVIICINVGATVVIMEKFDALAAIEILDKYKVTHSQWVPTMFIRMLKLSHEDRSGYDLSSHRVAIHSAAPIPIAIKEKMIAWWGPILFEYYTGSEMNGLTVIKSEEWLQNKGSVGKAILGTIKILDDDLNEMPAGKIGTIYFADGQSFEYHNDPQKTASAHTSQGWSTINDVGYVDEEGYLYLTDRKSNMIISGGVNIYPQEAENVLITHPKVLDVAVIGVPHEDFGETPKGVVQLNEPSEAGPEMEIELITYCRSRLSKIKCPTSIEFVDELPRTPTGKLLKRLLS